jgi:hypothetical protein
MATLTFVDVLESDILVLSANCCAKRFLELSLMRSRQIQGQTKLIFEGALHHGKSTCTMAVGSTRWFGRAIVDVRIPALRPVRAAWECAKVCH